MKTFTLQRLMVSFDDTRRYHIACALLETDPERQSRARHRAHRAGAMLDAIRFELSEREASVGRSVDEAQRTNRYLQRLLEEFLDQRGLDEVQTPGSVSPDTTDEISRVRIRPPARFRRSAGRS